jgi:hypothetical protein
MLVICDDDEDVGRSTPYCPGGWRVGKPTDDGGHDEHDEHERTSDGGSPRQVAEGSPVVAPAKWGI